MIVILKILSVVEDNFFELIPI